MAAHRWNTVLYFISLGVCLHLTSASKDVYVSDHYGNVVYMDGTVRYVRPVPVGNATYDTTLSYDEAGLNALYGLARSFVKGVQPNSFPFDILEEIANETFVLEDDYTKIIDHFYGITACLVIGVLFLLVFIIGGCCFCCCHCCCGNCGGDQVQEWKRNEGCRRKCLNVALILMVLCMLSGGVLIMVTNERFTDAIKFSNESLISNIDDMDKYLKNTGEEFRYLVTDMYDLIHQALQNDLVNLGTLSAQQVFENLKVDEFIQDVSHIDSYLNNVSILLVKTQNDISSLQAATLTLATALGTLADDINVTISGCPSDCQLNICDDLDLSAFRDGIMNSSALPDFSDYQVQIDDVKSKHNFTTIAEETLEQLETIAIKIDDFSSDIKSEVNKTLMAYRDVIYSLSTGVFQTMTEAFPTEQTKKKSNDIIDTVSGYDNYRRWFGVGLTIAFLGLVILFAVALVLGIAFHDSSALPTQRSSGSNCGGHMLIVGVVLLFIIGALLLILTILAFLFGSLLEKGCEPLEDLTLFKDFLDKDKVPGYSLSKIVLGDATVSLSTYDVLVGCRADETPWTVLKMGEVVPLEESLKYINFIGNIGQEMIKLQSVDLGGVQFLTRKLSNAINEIEDMDLYSIDFTSILSITIEPATSLDVDLTLQTMASFQDVCDDPTKTRWRDHLLSLEAIRDTEIVSVDNAAEQLKEALQVLEKNIHSLSNLTMTVLDLANNADDQIQNNMTQVLLQASVGIVGRIFSMLDGYVSEVVYLIYNNLGNCLPLWNLYKSCVVVVCDYGVDTLNGYWFSIGWGLLFFGPIIVVAILLAKYYKTMDYALGYKEFDDIIQDGEYTRESIL